MGTAATAACAAFMWSDCQLCEYLYFQTLIFPPPVVVGIIFEKSSKT